MTFKKIQIQVILLTKFLSVTVFILIQYKLLRQIFSKWSESKKKQTNKQIKSDSIERVWIFLY